MRARVLSVATAAAIISLVVTAPSQSAVATPTIKPLQGFTRASKVTPIPTRGVPTKAAPVRPRSAPVQVASLHQGATQVALSAGGTATMRLPRAAGAPATITGPWVDTTSDLLKVAPASLGESKDTGVVHVNVHVTSTGTTRSGALAPISLELSSPDPTSSPAPVAVWISDKAIASIAGGGLTGRLRWSQTVGRTRPQVVPTTSSHGGTVLVATVGSNTTQLTALATATSDAGAGSYAATPLSPAGSWGVQSNTGAFTWSLPMRVPPPAAGGSPTIALNYNSQSTDGETGATNNQPSDVGEGWSVDGSGSIDRVFDGCSTSDRTSTPIANSGDLCWGTDNATVSFAGHSGALVHGTNGSWRIEGDDNTRIEYKTGTTNGTADGGYWVLTTTDGVAYYFGLNRLPGWTTGARESQSAWTVPVCGNSTTACTGSASTATPFANQAWRWNLDYVVDPHGNAKALVYAPQTNAYQEKGTTKVTYIRGGALTEIDYGMRTGALFTTNAAAGKVLFTNVARCLTGQTGEPATACSPATPTAAYWPDTPWDQNCTAATCTQKSPSFWSTTMVAAVTTQTLVSGAYANVDSWALTHTWPATNDSFNPPALWLSQVTHTGYVGGTSALSPITFTGQQLRNRTNAIDGLTPLVKYRLNKIVGETGRTTSITYSPEPTAATSPTAAVIYAAVKANPQTNTYRAFPQWWTPKVTPAQAAQLDVFNKYTVSAVRDDPVTGDSHSTAQESNYLYQGSPAWKFNQAPGVPDNQRTWSVWAGYETVEVRQGNPAAPATMHTSATTYLRGLNGDPNGPLTSPTSARRSVAVTASGKTVTDEPWWAGRVLRHVIRVGSTAGAGLSTTPALTDTVTVPWASASTANTSRTYTYKDPVSGTTYTGTLTNDARHTADASTTTIQTSSTGTKTVITTNDINAYGHVWRTQSVTPDAGTTCTTTTFASNTTSWLIDYPSASTTVDVACNATVTYPTDVMSATQTFYDNSTTLGTGLTKADVTMKQIAASYAGSTPSWQTTDTYAYDVLGRVTSHTDPRTSPAATTTTAYTPTTTGPLTQSIVTGPKAPTMPATPTTTTTIAPQWGLPTQVVDQNANTTTITYDALGRISGLWKPNRPKATNTIPSVGYTYALNTTKPSVITTATITSGGTKRGYDLYDGLGQLRQHQEPAPGSAGGYDITDYTHDAVGQVTLTSAPWFATSVTPGTVVIPQLSLPMQTQTVYDGAGRATATILLGSGTEKWRTTTTYTGVDKVDTSPPAGGTPTTTLTDALGRTTSLTQYATGVLGGSPQTTTYTYDARDNRTGLVQGGQTWTWTYNVLGQLTQSADPDSGTRTYTYDPAGNTATTTDAKTQQLSYSYDLLGRKTALWSGPVGTGTQRAGWAYDTATKGSGLLASATRYVGGTAGAAGTGTAYTTRTSGYTTLGAPVDQTFFLGGTSLNGTYTTTFTYGADGSPTSQTDPAMGGLPAETIGYGYDSLGNLAGLDNPSTTGLLAITYDSLGRLGETNQYGAGTTLAHRVFTWDNTTNRMSAARTEHNSSTNVLIANHAYTYNNAGLATSDQTSTVSSGTDTQCYTHDGLLNLTAAWTPANNSCAQAPTPTTPMGGPAPYWTSWDVNPATGNRTATTRRTLAADGTTSASITDTYTYGDTSHPHGVTQVSHSDGAAVDDLTYDANGSTLTLKGQQVGYDVEGRTDTQKLTATAVTSTNVYTADGDLLVQSDPTTGTTAFLGDTQLHKGASATLVTGSRTYSAGGTPVAEMDTSISGSTTVATTYFLAPDPHHTATIAINATNSIFTSRYSDPFGNARGPAPSGTAPGGWTSNHNYLNAPQELLTTTGPTGGSPTVVTDPISRLGARDYDPVLGRFLQVDPVLDAGNPQQLNGYSYASNSPVAFSDPSGRILIAGDTPGQGQYVDEHSGKVKDRPGDGAAKDHSEPGTGNSAEAKAGRAHGSTHNDAAARGRAIVKRAIHEYIVNNVAYGLQDWCEVHLDECFNPRGPSTMDKIVFGGALVATGVVVCVAACTVAGLIAAAEAASTAALETYGGSVGAAGGGAMLVRALETERTASSGARTGESLAADIGHAGIHQFPGTKIGKSQFFDAEDLSRLSNTEGVAGVLQKNGNTRFVMHTTGAVGVDRTTGLPTDVYTVIRKPDGSTLTMFPGTSPKS